MNVTRYDSAELFLKAALPLLMIAEAENNLILGVTQGLARNPSAAKDPYLATVEDGGYVLACAVYIAPYKLLITRANRKPIVALASDVFQAVPDLDAVSGPARSATDFVTAWSRLSGIPARIGMRLRIHETRAVVDSGLPKPPGLLRPAMIGDLEPLIAWAEAFVAEARLPEKVDAAAVVGVGVKRGRLHVWDDGGPVSMAAWTGKTPNGVRLNFIYTPREHRGKGYATACVSALTRQQLGQGSAFCWLYADLSSGASPNIFKRIGYWPVSDVTEYYLKESPRADC
jgi:predicted GNAT family acetyltransferase